MRTPVKGKKEVITKIQLDHWLLMKVVEAIFNRPCSIKGHWELLNAPWIIRSIIYAEPLELTTGRGKKEADSEISMM